MQSNPKGNLSENIQVCVRVKPALGEYPQEEQPYFQIYQNSIVVSNGQ